MLTPHMHTHIQRWVSGLGMQKRLRKGEVTREMEREIRFRKDGERERGRRNKRKGNERGKYRGRRERGEDERKKRSRRGRGDKRRKRCVCAGRETDGWCEMERVCVCVCEKAAVDSHWAVHARNGISGFTVHSA